MHGGAAHLTAPFSLGNPGQSPPAHQALGCPNPRSEPCKEGIRHVVTVYQGGSDNLTGYRDRRTRLAAGLLPAAVTWVGLRNDSQHSRVGIERSAGTKAGNLAQFHATCSGRVTDSGWRNLGGLKKDMGQVQTLQRAAYLSHPFREPPRTAGVNQAALIWGDENPAWRTFQGLASPSRGPWLPLFCRLEFL